MESVELATPVNDDVEQVSKKSWSETIDDYISRGLTVSGGDETAEDTPPVDDVAPSDDPGNSEDPAQQNEPFLAVNDRTTYKSREDAIKGFNEAGQRIAALSGWEKEAKNWGLNDPRQFSDVARELLALRQEQGKWKEQINATPKPADDPTKRFADAGLDPKQAAEVQKYLDKLGYVPAAKLAELEAKFEERFSGLTQRSEAETQRYYQNQEATGRAEIGSWLKTANLADESGRRGQIVGSLIKEAIDNDPSLNERWFNGGPEAIGMVKELFNQFVKELGWQPAVAAGAANGTNYAAEKKTAIAVNKKLPSQGTGARANVSSSVAKRDPWADMHERARQVYEKTLASS